MVCSGVGHAPQHLRSPGRRLHLEVAMRKLVHSLASLKLAVGLLVALVVGLASGTILESRSGAEEAGRMVYYSWWFLVLQGVFAANVIAAIARYYPWGRTRVGFLTTHSAIVVILVGAA